VTGLGLVTPLGCGVEFVWQRVINKKSGIESLQHKGYEKLPCRVAGVVPKAPNEEGKVRIIGYKNPARNKEIELHPNESVYNCCHYSIFIH